MPSELTNSSSVVIAPLEEKLHDPAVVRIENSLGAEETHVTGIASQNQPVLRRELWDEVNVTDRLADGGDVVLQPPKGPERNRDRVVPDVDRFPLDLQLAANQFVVNKDFL